MRYGKYVTTTWLTCALKARLSADLHCLLPFVQGTGAYYSSLPSTVMTFYSSYGSPPPSSPASSPSPYVDSSPPSSPGTEPFDLDSDNWSRDPYAASTKATKSPKIYEKKRARSISPSAPPFEAKKSRFTDDETIERTLINDLRPESEIWDDAVADAIDNCHGLLDLEYVFNAHCFYGSLFLRPGTTTCRLYRLRPWLS